MLGLAISAGIVLALRPVQRVARGLAERLEREMSLAAASPAAGGREAAAEEPAES